MPCLSAWLRQDGIERATIGMLAWVGLAYSVKFLWSPIVDRLRLPLLHRLLGRRRSWMLVAQVGIGIVAILHQHLSDPLSINSRAAENQSENFRIIIQYPF